MLSVETSQRPSESSASVPRAIQRFTVGMETPRLAGVCASGRVPVWRASRMLGRPRLGHFQRRQPIGV